ncbi:NAD(P)/FAD-dependent oxidoreductase [bacterium]|nr:MAG: NAD(P)/FAD-dependent oxidoreductase [bacterium]
METVNVVIIGAGVIGLSIASKISRPGLSLYVLERNNAFGQEISSRNSEVIHAGIYYPSSSLKAKLCARGNRMLYDWCARNNTGFKNTGKLIVATDNQEENELQNLLKRGRENGVEGLRMLSREEVKEAEPNIEARAAIFSPATGIIDTHKFMKQLVEQIKENNGEVVYNSEVSALNRVSSGYEVSIRDSSAEIFKIKTRVLINSAGLESDKIAEMAGIDPMKNDYILKYCKGQYFRVANNKKCKLINRLIYPVPHERASGLGVHATKDLAGGLRLGPDNRYVDRKRFDYNVDINDKGKFLASALKFLPFLEDGDLTPDTSGIRPKLQGENEDFRDFVIKEESGLGLPGLVNLIGIESPGLTCSLAIGEYVKGLINQASLF